MNFSTTPEPSNEELLSEFLAARFELKSLGRFTERDMERAMRYADADPYESIELDDLAEVYADERERFARMADDFALSLRAQDRPGQAAIVEEFAERIRADRGGL